MKSDMSIFLGLALAFGVIACAPALEPDNYVFPESHNGSETPENPDGPSKPAEPTFEKTFSSQYAVAVETSEGWQNINVHQCLCSDASKHGSLWNDFSNSKALRDTMSFCIVEHNFDSPVKIRVKKLDGSTYKECEIRPSTYGIPVTKIDRRTVEFELPSYSKRKVSVEFDGDRYHNLILFANKPYESVPKDEANVKYFGPGFHDAGNIYLTEGQTLFLDYDAYVYGQVIATGSNITIEGNGVLSGQKMKHYGDNTYSWGDYLLCFNMKPSKTVTNLNFKDFTLIDGPGWNFIIAKGDGISIDGVNDISWELNGDGFDLVSCTNVEISNCFIRTYDDCITLKTRFNVTPMTDCAYINIHDCQIWADYARGIVVGPEAGRGDEGHIHDVTVSDCIFMEQTNGSDGKRAAFSIEQDSGGSTGSPTTWDVAPAKMYSIHAKNLTFENLRKAGRAITIFQFADSGVLMDDVRFENIKVVNKSGNNYPALGIKTSGATITNLKIDGLYVNGTPITGVGSQVDIDRPENVSVEF